MSGGWAFFIMYDNSKEVDKLKMLHTKAFVEDMGKKDGVIEAAVITSEVVDREGEVLKASGGNFEEFNKNPQLLWMHNRRDDRPPIGKVLKVWQDGKRWLFTPQFDLKDSFAADIYRKFKEGFLNAFSIGFLPSEKEGNMYTMWKALEFSAVPVPANAEATVILRSKGFETLAWKDIMGNEVVDWKKVSEQLYMDQKEILRDFKELAIEHSRVLKILKNNQRKVRDNPTISDIKDLSLILNQATSKVLHKLKGGEK